MTRVTQTLLGEVGFERAVVWSVTGFALSLVAVRSAGSVGTDSVTVAAACAAVAATGVAGFTRVGGGLFPGVLLAYGPVAAVLLELVGPRIRFVAGGGIAVETGDGTIGDPISTALVVGEPFALALAGAVALAVGGFLVGRGLAAVGGTNSDADAGSGSGSGTGPDSQTADADG